MSHIVDILIILVLLFMFIAVEVIAAEYVIPRIVRNYEQTDGDRGQVDKTCWTDDD